MLARASAMLGLLLSVAPAVPGSTFQVPGSCSSFGSSFCVLCSAFSVRTVLNAEPRTSNREPGTEPRTRTRNEEQGTGNRLPERDTFLREVREALGRSQQVAHRYAYKERRTDVHLNPFGRLGTGDTRLLQVYPAPNPQLTYRRLIERNGQPVSKGELDLQDSQYRDRAAQVQRRLAREDAEARRERERDDSLARRRAEMVIGDVVNVLQFEIVRREMRDGVAMIVVGFAGRPDARPTTRQGRIARVFKGHIWVREASREIAHIDALAVDDVSFGGFIAKLYEGTRAEVTRREIDRDVWMPTEVKLSGDIRALFRRTKIDYAIEWFDYRPMSETSLPLNARVKE
jgi:hypothetical protein